jgi:osomolarity two-component system sensor histidine kinase NIK1
LEILLVEDNVLNQKVVTFNLRKQNYNVTTVSCGSDAISQIKNNSFDLILMDIMLPEMDGFEITAEIRKYEKEADIKKQVPIIALTANTLDNDREKCIQAGMNEYLAKPFTAQELVTVIQEFIPKE